MDYGEARHFSNSFRVRARAIRPFEVAKIASHQAFRGHQIVDVFDDPGSADLTANVDFAYLAEALSGIGERFPVGDDRPMY